VRSRSPLIVALIAASLASRASAQGAAHPVAVTRLDATPRSASLAPPPVNYWDLRAMSPYAGWGGAIGATGGLVWALAEHSDSRFSHALNVVAYPIVGFAAGLVGGAVVYIVHEAVSR